MLRECMDVLEAYALSKAGNLKKFILDGYIPKDGTYFLVTLEESGYTLDDGLIIKQDKKTRQIDGSSDSRYSYIRELDYNSQLISMNKPMDPGKTIHSNNYFSIFFKQNNLTNLFNKNQKVTGGRQKPQPLDAYFSTLENPQKKYASKKTSRKIYEQLEASIGAPNIGEIQRIKSYAEDILKRMLDDEGIDKDKKDYLKLFFVYPDKERTIELYERENKRYLVPNIFNSNDYNITVENEIFGLQNDNMGLNSKKPFLLNRSRRNSEMPRLINTDEAQKLAHFFMALSNYTALAKNCLYLDVENNEILAYSNIELPPREISGYFLQLQPDKNEVAILDFDVLVGYSPVLSTPCTIKPIIPIQINKRADDEIIKLYKQYRSKTELLGQIDSVLFYNRLRSGLFLDPSKIGNIDDWLKHAILFSRESIINWAYKGKNIRLTNTLGVIADTIINETMYKGYYTKAVQQSNLYYSLMEHWGKEIITEETMSNVVESYQKHLKASDSGEAWDFSSDEEYFFAIGQLVYYLHSQSKTSSENKTQAVFKPFLSTKNKGVLLRLLSNLHSYYAHAIKTYHVRFNRVLAMVLMYKPEGSVNTNFLRAGILHNNFFYEKKEEVEK